MAVITNFEDGRMNFKILVLATRKFNYVVLSCFIQLWLIEKIVFGKAVFSHFPRSYEKDKAFYTNIHREGTAIPVLNRFFLLTDSLWLLFRRCIE